ncbi:hypothetical protein CPC08DRAFT_711385 [Agrocybe pediades]|nr:hypothetical protein CPC08DRAFT_711385 [Agrocybe pediades]
MSTTLPALATLKLNGSPITRLRPASGILPHERFLKWRKEIGKPIAVLDLGVIMDNMQLSTFPRQMDHFEGELAGLLVMWSIYRDGRCAGEYRCGDGYPQKLRYWDTCADHGHM